MLAGAYYDDTTQGSNTGSVLIFSGATGALIRKLTDPASLANDYLGVSVAALPDVNGDGIPDVAAGATQNDAAATDAGRVTVFSGADGTVLYRFVDPAAGGTDNLGTAVAAIADVSGGGKPEILAGAEGAPLPEGQDAGKVVVFSFESDCDGDGRSALLDCNDADALVGPGALERCNSVDDDCDGLVDEDNDGDGVAACAGDCNNGDPRVRPGAAERCNAADDDCDGSTDEGPDADGDGVTAPCDCDDGRNAVHPGAVETCNGRDDDCDGVVDEGTPAQLTGLGLASPAPAALDAFGQGAANVGDVDLDGVDDFAVGAPQDDIGAVSDRGSVVLFSGATRTARCTATDPEGLANNYLGWSVAGVGDLDHDGRPDFAAGAIYDDVASAYNAGSVVVFSGATCARLLKLTDPGERATTTSARRSPGSATSMATAHPTSPRGRCATTLRPARTAAAWWSSRAPTGRYSTRPAIRGAPTPTCSAPRWRRSATSTVTGSPTLRPAPSTTTRWAGATPGASCSSLGPRGPSCASWPTPAGRTTTTSASRWPESATSTATWSPTWWRGPTTTTRHRGATPAAR